MRILAAFSLSLSAAVFLANYIWPVNALLPIAAVCAVLTVGLLLTKRKWLRGAVLALSGFAVGLAVFLVKFDTAVKPCRALDGQTIEIDGVILDYPVEYDDYCRTELLLDGENTPQVKTLIFDSEKTIASAKPGQRLRCTAKLNSADMRYGEAYDRYNAKEVFLIADLKEMHGLSDDGFKLSALPALIRKSVSGRIDSLFDPEISAFLRSVTLGDKSGLYENRSLYTALSEAGIMHVAAVSGMHIAFLVGLLQLIFGAGRRGAITSIILVWSFVIITGCSPSAIRAGFMQSLLLLAPVLRRENDPLTSLSAVLAMVLIKNPYAAASISLQLSFGAMAGILCFSGKIYKALTQKMNRKKKKHLSYIMGVFSGSLSVMIFTLPLTFIYFGYVPLLAPLSNLLTTWAVSVSFCGTFLSLFLSLLPGPFGKAAAFVLSLAVRYIFAVVRLISAVPFCTLYLTGHAAVIWMCGGLLILLVLHFSGLKTGVKAVTGAASILALLFAVYGLTAFSYKKDLCSFNVLDVGQGQSIVIMSGENTVMVDCGGGAKEDNAAVTASGFLLSRGRRRLDALVLTHLHSDHANGTLDLLEKIAVDRLIISSDLTADEELLPQIKRSAEEYGTEIVYLDADREMSFGGLHLELFIPEGGKNTNESCLMCRIGADDYDMLITADAPMKVEKELISTHDLSGTDFLIVGHHGSRSSCSTELLESLDAETAIISVGYNSYGHPTNETLARLKACGYNILRTDLNGTVEIRIR